MAVRRLAPFHWALWAGFALRVLGGFWDGQWHKTHGHFDDAASVLQAHWLMLLGTLVMFVAPLLALRHRSELRTSRLLGLGFMATALFGLAQLLGSAWDTGLHLGLLHLAEAPGHLLQSIGWYGSALGLAGIASAYMLSTPGQS